MWHVNILLFFFFLNSMPTVPPQSLYTHKKKTLQVEGKSGTQHKGSKLNHS